MSLTSKKSTKSQGWPKLNDLFVLPLFGNDTANASQVGILGLEVNMITPP